jgi:probable HAF family extracellular repeat protein
MIYRLASASVRLGTACFVAAVWAVPTSAQIFQGLGDIAGGGYGSGAYKVSRDGGTVVGYASSPAPPATYQAMRWTQSGGIVGLGDFPGGGPLGSVANSVNASGSVIVGSGTGFAQPYTAFRWTQATGLVSLGDIDANSGTSSLALDVSDDGNVIALLGAYAASGTPDVGQAARWTPGSGLTPLGFLPGGDYSYAAGVSADGSVIIGGGTVGGGGSSAFRWTQATGMVSLGDVAGGVGVCIAQDLSADGSVVVGSAATAEGQLAMRWTQATGMVSLGDIPGGPTGSIAMGVSDNGNTVVGIANSTYNIDANGDAFIWTPQRGMRLLKDAVMADYSAPQLEGWHLISAWSISGDGRTIVGEGINPLGHREAYIVRLGGGPCPADFNHDGAVNVRDFLAFLAAYAAGCP